MNGSRLVRVVQEDLKVGAGEVFVAIARDGGFEDGHTVEIAQEVRALDGSGVYAFVAEFAEEAAIAKIDGIGDTAEIADIVISGTSVDMVNGHTGRDLLLAPSDIDGMRSKDLFTLAKSMLEVQVPLFALCIVFYLRILARCRSCIFQYFSTVGIDAHTDHTALTVVGVEGDVVLGVRADIGNPHVVKEEGRIFQLRQADDFKFALSHNNRGFGCRQGRQR